MDPYTATYLTSQNHPSKTNKTCGTLLEKQGQTHKWRSPMDPYMVTYLPSSHTIQVRRTRHVGHCWRSKDKLISDFLLWTPTRSLTSHPTNHPSMTNKTCGTLLEKQGQTHKWRFPMDPYTWTCQCWLTNKSLFTSALCRHWM